MLTAGATLQIPTDTWQFTIRTEKGQVHRWSWDEMHSLGVEDFSVDIHCVTHWSRLGVSWRGVPLDKLFRDVDTDYDFVMAHSHGDYTTNIALDELLDGQAWIAFEADGTPLSAEHGGPARLLVPHLYFWKSAKWIKGLVMQRAEEPGFWESRGYNIHGDPLKEERYW